jgi:NAD(P)-dependent dehydrogenase (short-subunit alcohol dehydrogenase family)
MNSIASGTVLITGPTGGLGRAATLAMADRAAPERPDLLLVGRPGRALTEVAADARAAGATVHEIGCDLARLADVRAAGRKARDLLAAGQVRPLRALVANANVIAVDTRSASADGFEPTLRRELPRTRTAHRRSPRLARRSRAHRVAGVEHLPPGHFSPDVESPAGGLARPDRVGSADRPGPAGDFRAGRDRILELQTRDPLLRARTAAPSTSGDQRGGVRAGIHAGHRPPERCRPRCVTDGAHHCGHPGRLIADPIRCGACVDRPRRSLGASAGRRLRRQGHRTRRAAVHQGSDP